jgi:hypothetical protein
MPKPGDRVLLVTLPEWVDKLPPESQAVFRFCVGRIYRVSEISPEGEIVLDVSTDVDARFGGVMNDIRVEPEYVTLSEPE